MSNNSKSETQQISDFINRSFWFFQCISMEVFLEIILPPINRKFGEEHIISKLVDHAGSAAAFGVIIYFILLVRSNKNVVNTLNEKIASHFNDDWTYGKKYSFMSFWYNFFLSTPVNFYNYIKRSFYFAVPIPVGCAILLLLLNGDGGSLAALGTIFNMLSILVAIDGKRITQTIKSIVENENQLTNEPVA